MSVDQCLCWTSASHSFKYECREIGRQSDRQAANRWILTNPVQFHRGRSCVYVCASECVLQLNLASVQKSNVSVAGLGWAASEEPTKRQSPNARRCLQGSWGEEGAVTSWWGEQVCPSDWSQERDERLKARGQRQSSTAYLFNTFAC